MLTVCFIGVGSIAKRHIRNLHSVCDERGISLSIDALRRSGDHIDGVDNIYKDDSELNNCYDAIFITNPTSLHLETLKKYHSLSKCFFIEKPVVSLPQITEAFRFETKPGNIYYVACPLRYNPVIQYISTHINKKDVISVRSISSSYLPEWRPGQDYRITYSANKEMGGGVSIDLIHEWDYLTFLFGWPQRVSSYIGKKSNLEIDSDDYAIYLAEYNDKIIELHLDYFGRVPIRQIQIFTNEETVIGDLINNSISFLKEGRNIHFNEDRDDYQKRELNHFINLTKERAKTENGFMHGLRVLSLTQGCLS